MGRFQSDTPQKRLPKSPFSIQSQFAIFELTLAPRFTMCALMHRSTLARHCSLYETNPHALSAQKPKTIASGSTLFTKPAARVIAILLPIQIAVKFRE